MKKIILSLTLLGLCVSVAGCGRLDGLNENAVYLQEDSTAVTEVLVSQLEEGESFTQDDLSAYVESDTEYLKNDYGQDAVTVEELSLSSNGEILIRLVYKDYSIYQASHNETFFYGTIQEALDAGYTIPDELLDRGGNTVSTDKYTGNPERYHVIVFAEPLLILTDTRILGATSNVTILDNRTAEAALASESEDSSVAVTIPDAPAYIICK